MGDAFAVKLKGLKKTEDEVIKFADSLSLDIAFRKRKEVEKYIKKPPTLLGLFFPEKKNRIELPDELISDSDKIIEVDGFKENVFKKYNIPKKIMWQGREIEVYRAFGTGHYEERPIKMWQLTAKFLKYLKDNSETLDICYSLGGIVEASNDYVRKSGKYRNPWIPVKENTTKYIKEIIKENQS